MTNTESPVTVAPGNSGADSVRGALRMLIGEGLIVPTGLITVAYLTRRFGPEGYGVFTLAATIILYVEYAITSFFSRATIRFVGTVDDPAAVITTASRLRLAVDLAAMLLMVLAAPAVAGFLGEPEMTEFLRIFALEIPLFGRARTLRDSLMGLGRYDRPAAAMSIRWISRLILIVILVEAGMSIRGAVIASVAASALEALVNRMGVGREMLRGSRFPIRRLLGYAVPLLVTSVILLVFSRLDLFMLKLLGTPTAGVGVYAAAQNAALTLGIVAMAVSPVVLSSLSRARARGDQREAETYVRNALRVVLMLGPFVALLSFSAPEIVPLLFGRGFESAAPVLSILVFASLVLMLHSIGTTMLTAAARPGLVLALSAPVPILALAGHLVAIPRYGMTGAATVTLAVSCLVAAATVVAVARAWHALPRIATVVGCLISTILVGAAASIWSTPGLLLLGKLGLLTAISFVLLTGLGVLKWSEIRLALTALAIERSSSS